MADSGQYESETEQVEEMYAGERAIFESGDVHLEGTIDRCRTVRQDGVAVVVLKLDEALPNGQEEFFTPLDYLEVL